MNTSDPIVRAELLLDRAVADCRPTLEAAGYVPDQPDDIGRLLWLLLAAGMVRLTEESRADRLNELTDSLRKRRIGPRRLRRHARPLVRLVGAEGVALPAGVTAQSAGGGRRAVLARRPLALARLGEAAWFDGRGLACPPSGAGEDAGPVDLTPVPYADVHSLSLPLTWGPAPAGTTPAGLLWDVPAAIGSRVTSVMIHCGASRRTGIPMWTPTGQVLVPLGRVGGGLPDRVEIGVRLAPAQLRHAGRVFSNVTVARELAPPEYDDATPAGDGPIDTLTHAAGADIGVTEVAGGWPAQRGESVSAWRRRADAAFRHGGRAVTRSDYADLVAARFPELCVLQVEPCRLGPAARRVDGVRVVIVPRRWASAYDLLNRAAAAAPRVARLLQPKAVAGVQVDVGPPAVAVNDPPPLSDPLSVYGEFLAVGPGTARRPDHPDWPTYRLDEIPQATQEGE